MAQTRMGMPKYAGKTMSKDDFLRWESDDEYVYEWNEGVLEPTQGMKQEEMQIARLLCRSFTKTEAYRQKGELMLEIDCWLTKQQMRRPDLAFYTDEQILKANKGERSVPTFVIEIISEFDELIKVEKKLIEYFEAGVQVVWRVIVEMKTVYVYTSPKTIVVCTENDLVSAAPAVPDFQVSVQDLLGDK